MRSLGSLVVASKRQSLAARGAKCRRSVRRDASSPLLSSSAEKEKNESEELKGRLRAACSASKTGAVEEAARALTEKGKEKERKAEKLRGKLWKLLFAHSAIPSPPLLPPPMRVNTIHFRFFEVKNECEIELKATIPMLLKDADGFSIRLSVAYQTEEESILSIEKTREIRMDEIRISELTEMLVALAILPRTSVNHFILRSLRDMEFRFPVLFSAAIGFNYELEYCDSKVLIFKG